MELYTELMGKLMEVAYTITEKNGGNKLHFNEKPIKLRGELHFTVKRGGRVIDKYDNHNMIMTAARELMAKILTGGASESITHIGVGSGTAAETTADTGLTGQILVALTKRSSTGNVARFDFTLGENDANGLNIHEFGLFTSSGIMFSHRVRDEKKDLVKASDLTIEGYWTINF